MPVFLSHRTVDDRIAQSVAHRLKSHHDINCYVDDFDKEANTARGTNRITTLIVSRLNMCTHLLALVTENTKGSWWVPFEIGVARRAPRAISTFTNLSYGLPEYLTEWPVLRGESAVDKFAAAYKSQIATAKRMLTAEATTSFDERALSVDSFHTRLKASLGQ